MEKSDNNSQTAKSSSELEKTEVPVEKRKSKSLIPWVFTGLILIAIVAVIVIPGVKKPKNRFFLKKS